MKVQDLQTNDPLLWSQYVQYFASGNYTAALTILGNTQLDNKKMTASVFNAASSNLTALQSLYADDVTNVLAANITKFNQMIADLAYTQSYNAATIYVKGNFVMYENNVYVYIAAQPSSGNLPTDTAYWLLLGLRGLKGIDGVGLKIKYAWSNTVQYAANDVVTYQQKIYYAKTENLGVTPGTSADTWGMIFEVPIAKIYTGSTIPAEPYAGLLWFATVDPYTFDEVDAMGLTFDGVDAKAITWEQVDYGGW